MTLIADILMIAGALGAAFYCFILSRRLSRFSNLEGGMGGAVAVLSVQVDDLTKALEQANQSSKVSADVLSELTERAEKAASQIELLMASMHDLPDVGQKTDRSRNVRRNRHRRTVASIEEE